MVTQNNTDDAFKCGGNDDAFKCANDDTTFNDDCHDNVNKKTADNKATT